MSTDAGHGPRLRDDVVAAVQASFASGEVEGVLSNLNRLDEDRVVVAVLVLAMIPEPDPGKVRDLVDLAVADYRDVLTVEYEPPADYKAALAKLGLVRPYPVE